MKTRKTFSVMSHIVIMIKMKLEKLKLESQIDIGHLEQGI